MKAIASGLLALLAIAVGSWLREVWCWHRWRRIDGPLTVGRALLVCLRCGKVDIEEP